MFLYKSHRLPNISVILFIYFSLGGDCFKGIGPKSKIQNICSAITWFMIKLMSPLVVEILINLSDSFGRLHLYASRWQSVSV